MTDTPSRFRPFLVPEAMFTAGLYVMLLARGTITDISFF